MNGNSSLITRTSLSYHLKFPLNYTIKFTTTLSATTLLPLDPQHLFLISTQMTGDTRHPHPGWINLHYAGRILSLHHVRLDTSGLPSTYFKICNPKNADLKILFPGFETPFFYKKIADNTLLSVFQWELYTEIKNYSKLHLLTFHEQTSTPLLLVNRGTQT